MSGKYINTHIGFIGGGNMAQAIIRGLLQAGHPAKKISVADPIAEQQQLIKALAEEITCTIDNATLAKQCDMLVLAVKPQIMNTVAEPLGQINRPDNQVIISVAAGITLASMSDWFGTDSALIRVMPNQPALIGEGMSGLCATTNVSNTDKQQATYVMEATGKALWFEDEQLMDAVTAISGSGPAYFYLIMEIMQEVAEEFGFDKKTARILSTQTALGAGHVAATANEELSDLRKRVTSPGGTTEAALKTLEAGGIRDMFRNALQAAKERSLELGKN
ncbi:MAG: pyrroline-5-carboxylate reductase [Gammaproteobacteria bacterium]|nr:pyrroline-5-carboxylate reductase [Gammaproteobacteria bacterium]MCP4091594.1 pyrroline-5-carboxylate reductase [Gammaproteobacteria bacterium]MCP4276090.1 pyrroline-5-carboxylate reductase [Gammaproteobacteria bacterium]MCP4832582.1 pyrroline-5-carboxylate reductase [Gammaproteobacteria bacterium]MCP4929660.1 pyrroline-5-carboxylate reductase [Gammaproteobacteria bacterium]